MAVDPSKLTAEQLQSLIDELGRQKTAVVEREKTPAEQIAAAIDAAERAGRGDATIPSGSGEIHYHLIDALRKLAAAIQDTGTASDETSETAATADSGASAETGA